MKVYIGPYKEWWGPYQIANLIPFLSEETKENIGCWLSKTWVNDFCNWFYSKNERTIKVRIDKYDTWSMDNTLAHIILPMLKQLQATKHGAPFTDDADVPEYLRSYMAQPKENEWDIDDLHFMRWDWILKEMIWAFEQKVDDTSEDQFFDHSQWNGKKPWDPEYTGPEFDKEGYDKWHERKSNGFRLFGKYYENLWD